MMVVHLVLTWVPNLAASMAELMGKRRADVLGFLLAVMKAYW